MRIKLGQKRSQDRRIAGIFHNDTQQRHFEFLHETNKFHHSFIGTSSITLTFQLHLFFINICKGFTQLGQCIFDITPINYFYWRLNYCVMLFVNSFIQLDYPFFQERHPKWIRSFLLVSQLFGLRSFSKTSLHRTLLAL